MIEIKTSSFRKTHHKSSALEIELLVMYFYVLILGSIFQFVHCLRCDATLIKEVYDNTLRSKFSYSALAVLNTVTVELLLFLRHTLDWLDNFSLDAVNRV